MGNCPGRPGAPLGQMPPGAVAAKVLGTGPSYPITAPAGEEIFAEPVVGCQGLGPGHPPVEVVVAGASAPAETALVPVELDQALTRLNGLGAGAAGSYDDPFSKLDTNPES